MTKLDAMKMRRVEESGGTRKGTKRLLATGILLAGLAVSSCNATPTYVPPTPSPSATYTVKPGEESPTPTEKPSPTETATPEPSPTPTETATPIPPSPTPTVQVYQTLGRIFPPGYDSLGVWSNHYDPEFEGRSGLHFDVGLPYNFVSGQDPVLSPASGRIVEVYWVGEGGNEGQVITIEPNPPLAGIEEMVSSAGLDPSTIERVLFHLGHITAWKTEGWVEAGEPVGTPFNAWFDPDKISYVIRVWFRNGPEGQFSPCNVPNTASFCGKCYPGTPNPCP